MNIRYVPFEHCTKLTNDIAARIATADATSYKIIILQKILMIPTSVVF